MMQARRILVVDDEPKIVDIIAEYLELKGFEVERAYDGREALEKIKNIPSIKLVILDKKMPIIDGVGVMNELKKMGSEIPVVVITGSIGMRESSLPKDLRYKKLLLKPVRLSHLLETINGILSPV